MENHGGEESIARASRGLQAAEQQQQQQPPSDLNQPVLVYDTASRSLFIRFPADAGSGKPGPLPASKASIDVMPRVTVTEDCVKDCAICLEEMIVGSEIREMPCKHGFHSSCIEKWLQIRGSCPVCRFMMPVEDGADDVGDGSEDGRRLRRRLIFVNLIVMESAESLSSSDLDSGSDSPPDSTEIGR